MKRLGIIVLLALPFALVVIFLATRMRWKFSGSSSPQSASHELVATNTTVPSADVPAGQPVRLLGESILQDYASPNLPPEHDLTVMSRLMENSLLLLKAAANRPLSANEDWADLLRGRNAARERFLPDTSSALNSQGQLIDRWQSPLFFHALGGGRYEIRSAGPDKRLWTEDDLHRNADGSFRRGTNLNSPSLREAATRGRSPSTGP